MILEHFIEFGKNLSRFVVGPEGNISFKWKDNSFLIKASGTYMSNMAYASIVECDLEGNKISIGNNKPSIEVGFHSWLYKNTKFKVIAHTHPTNLMKILCSNLIEEFPYVRMFPDQVVFNESKYCVIPYATPGKDLVNSISSTIGLLSIKPNILLLKNHGIICCADSFKEAIIMTEICEKSAEIFLDIQKFEPRYLSKKNIEDIRNNKLEMYRKNL